MHKNRTIKEPENLYWCMIDLGPEGLVAIGDGTEEEANKIFDREVNSVSMQDCYVVKVLKTGQTQR